VDVSTRKTCVDASRVENGRTVELNREPRKNCLGTLRSHKGTLPGNRFDVFCHATPAANEHFAVVEVSSEHPSASSPRVWFSLQTGSTLSRSRLQSEGTRTGRRTSAIKPSHERTRPKNVKASPGHAVICVCLRKMVTYRSSCYTGKLM
jgi:hypothetical protein